MESEGREAFGQAGGEGDRSTARFRDSPSRIVISASSDSVFVLSLSQAILLADSESHFCAGLPHATRAAAGEGPPVLTETIPG